MPHFPERLKTSQAIPDAVWESTYTLMPYQSTQRKHEPSEEEARTQRIRIKNRRKRWLDLHPEYFDSPHLESTNPLRYERLVRRFLTAAEREAQGRARGSATTLENNLLRSEAKLTSLREPDELEGPLTYTRAADGSIVGVEQDPAERVEGKEDGMERWRDFAARRFVTSGDEEVDMEAIDRDEGLDLGSEAENEHLEKWLDGQEEEFVGTGRPAGETGVQDF